MIKIECPSCEQRELPFAHPEAVCENCQVSFAATELKDKWADAFPDRIRPVKVFRVFSNFVNCAKCYDRTMIFHDGLKQWMCFSCFRVWRENQLRLCEYCKFHRTLNNFQRGDACTKCWKYYTNYDKYKSDKLPPAWMWKKYDFYKDKIFW